MKAMNAWRQLCPTDDRCASSQHIQTQHEVVGSSCASKVDYHGTNRRTSISRQLNDDVTALDVQVQYLSNRQPSNAYGHGKNTDNCAAKRTRVLRIVLDNDDDHRDDDTRSIRGALNFVNIGN